MPSVRGIPVLYSPVILSAETGYGVASVKWARARVSVHSCRRSEFSGGVFCHEAFASHLFPTGTYLKGPSVLQVWSHCHCHSPCVDLSIVQRR